MKTFNDCQEIERIAFETIVDKFRQFYNNRSQIMNYYLVYEDSLSHFDVIMNIHDENGTKIESNIIEIKVRNKHFRTLLLEKGKYNNLKRKQKKQLEFFDKVNLLYLNFTPTSTYLFNLDKVTIDWNTGYYNKSYVIDSNYKIKKEITLLNIEESTDMFFIFDKKTSPKRYLDKIVQQKIENDMFFTVKNLK